MNVTSKVLDDVAIPPGAVELSEWSDVGHPDGAWRSITGTRRGIAQYHLGNSPVGPHYVAAHAIQEADGRVVEACIRAEIQAWNLNRYEDWDTMLPPAEARRKAAELRSTIAELTTLAEAFEAAADEVDGWVTR